MTATFHSSSCQHQHSPSSGGGSGGGDAPINPSPDSGGGDSGTGASDGTCNDLPSGFPALSVAATYGICIPLLIICSIGACCTARRSALSASNRQLLLQEAHARQLAQRAEAGDQQASRDFHQLARHKKRISLFFFAILITILIYQLSVTGWCVNVWTAFGIAAPVCIGMCFLMAACSYAAARKIEDSEARQAVEMEGRQLERDAKNAACAVKVVGHIHGIGGSAPDPSLVEQGATKAAEHFRDKAEKHAKTECTALEKRDASNFSDI